VNLTLVFRNRPGSERLKVRAEELAKRLARHLQPVQHIEWDVTRDGAEAAVRCRVHARSGFFRAHARAARADTAMNLVCDKLLKERRREKAKRIGARRSA